MESVTLREGESHLVRLHGLGSAGYQWMLESSDPRIAAVEEILHSREEVAAPIAGSLDQRFRLTAITPGHTLVRFTQRRRFEPEREPHASYEVSVTVTG
jgi:predicted secreted protein